MASPVSRIDPSFFIHSIIANSPELSVNADVVHNLWRECLKNDPASRQAYELFSSPLFPTASFSSKINRKLVLSNHLHVQDNERLCKHSSSLVVSQVAFLQCSKPSAPRILCLPLLDYSFTDDEHCLSKCISSTLRPLLQLVYIPTLCHMAERKIPSSSCKGDVIKETLIQLLGELKDIGEIQEQESPTFVGTPNVHDFCSIQTPMEEVHFWEFYREQQQQQLLNQNRSAENYLHSPAILREMCSAWHDAKETFQILESSKDGTYGISSALSQFLIVKID